MGGESYYLVDEGFSGPNVYGCMEKNVVKNTGGGAMV